MTQHSRRGQHLSPIAPAMAMCPVAPGTTGCSYARLYALAFEAARAEVRREHEARRQAWLEAEARKYVRVIAASN